MQLSFHYSHLSTHTLYLSISLSQYNMHATCYSDMATTDPAVKQTLAEMTAWEASFTQRLQQSQQRPSAAATAPPVASAPPAASSAAYPGAQPQIPSSSVSATQVSAQQPMYSTYTSSSSYAPQQPPQDATGPATYYTAASTLPQTQQPMSSAPPADMQESHIVPSGFQPPAPEGQDYPSSIKKEDA